jgi:hypothetical protein
MTGSDDSTAAPGAAPSCGCASILCFAAGADGDGLRALQGLTALERAFTAPLTDDDVAAVNESSAALLRLEPQSLGDVVALLTAAPLVGGDCPRPDMLEMLQRAVGFLTRQAPGLRRPGLERAAAVYARLAHAC